MIRLLIVDDSALMRRLLGRLFAEAGDFIVEFARNGQEALETAAIFQPDVITLDIHMPEMDGLACLDRIMLQRPCPVVMISALTEEGAEQTLAALKMGAVDFVAKPTRAVSLEIDELGPLIVQKVRVAASIPIRRSRRLKERIRQAHSPPPVLRASRSETFAFTAHNRLVLIGSSTGGPPALEAILSSLPADFPVPIVVAQHMPATFTGPLSRRLDKLCGLSVVEVAQQRAIEPGHVYIAKGDADIILSSRAARLFALPAPSDAQWIWHPSVDRLVLSAMNLVAPQALIGILLTGMGSDGATAMADLKKAGGRTIAEAAETAVVWGMPGELVSREGASDVLPLGRIASKLLEYVQ
ncbi:UNVERIFIED_ORG: two-component system chemotaxis response regulator CheB [Ensifer adhaerens]|nr:two-component system chemotaxis response regulator CheB [Ensifer adhaerens]